MKFLFMVVIVLAVFGAQVFDDSDAGAAQVGTKITKYNDYLYEIIDTLTTLDGISGGVEYTIDIPGDNIAIMKMTHFISGDYAPGGADALILVKPVYHYGDGSHPSNDFFTAFIDLLDGVDNNNGAIYAVNDSVDGGGQRPS